MRPAYNGPEPPDDEGSGFAALVVTLIAIGVLSLVVLEQPDTTIFVGVVGLAVIGSIWGKA